MPHGKGLRKIFKMFFCYKLLIHVIYLVKKESRKKRLKSLSVLKSSVLVQKHIFLTLVIAMFDLK
jgi:hypothetical protein